MKLKHKVESMLEKETCKCMCFFVLYLCNEYFYFDLQIIGFQNVSYLIYLILVVGRGVQSGKTEPIKTEPNRNRKNGLDLVVPNIPNGCHF